MRTNGGNGRNVNDILALFDRLGDPFSGETKPGAAKPDAAAASPEAAAGQQPLVQKPGDTNANLGFDKEDRATLQQKPAPATDSKGSGSSDQKPKDARDKDAPREARDQTPAQSFANKLQDGLQKGLAAAFAKLASLGKGAEAAEPDPHVVPNSKDSAKSKDAKDAKDAKASAGSGGAAGAEEAHAGDPTNFASHTTEGGPDTRGLKAQEKAEEHIEQFREELRQMGPAERGDAKKLDKPRDGKEPHEIVHAEGAADSQELRQLVGGWHPEHCALEEEEKNANALRIEDALGEQMRCRGLLEDGTRCIRKPVMGIPYCREHASTVYAGEAGFVTIGAGVDASKAPVEVTEPEAVAYTDPADELVSEDVADPTLPDQPAYVVTD